MKELELEDKKQEEETQKALDEFQERWEKEKTKVKGAERRRVAREQGALEKSNQYKKKLEQGADTKSNKNKKRRIYELVGASWGEQTKNLLLNKKKEGAITTSDSPHPTLDDCPPPALT